MIWDDMYTVICNSHPHQFFHLGIPGEAGFSPILIIMCAYQTNIEVWRGMGTDEEGNV